MSAWQRLLFLIICFFGAESYALPVYSLNWAEYSTSLKKCQKESVINDHCRSILSTWQKISPILIRLQIQPEQVGIDLLHTQSRLVKLKNKPDQEANRALINQLENEIKRNYLILRWFESPGA